MSWKPRVATVDMVDSCTAIPQFFARRPSLFCLYNPPLLESIYHYISTMDLWIPVASHQMASPSLPIVSLQRCENEQLQSSKPETNRDLKAGEQQEQTQLGSATLQHEMAGDTCQCQYPADHCGPHCQDGAWLFFVTLRAFSQVGETEDIGNHRPSDNQIRYDPPESGAANPDSTPFSALKTAAQGHLGLRNSRNP